jgi:hypothetical protein
MFFPVTLVPVCVAIVVCFLGCALIFVVCGVVKLLLSLPSFTKNKKKLHFFFACSRNEGVVTSMHAK